jgi:hypothetical protein
MTMSFETFRLVIFVTLAAGVGSVALQAFSQGMPETYIHDHIKSQTRFIDSIRDMEEACVGSGSFEECIKRKLHDKDNARHAFEISVVDVIAETFSVTWPEAWVLKYRTEQAALDDLIRMRDGEFLTQTENW